MFFILSSGSRWQRASGSNVLRVHEEVLLLHLEVLLRHLLVDTMFNLNSRPIEAVKRLMGADTSQD
jgi:hypothetical protein